MAIRHSTRRHGAQRAFATIALAILGVALSAPAHATGRTLLVLTTDNRIAAIPEAQPGMATSAVSVTGLVVGDVLMAIDVRPQNGRLYGLGFNSTNGTVQLYHIAYDVAGARAVAMGATGTFVNAGGTPLTISGSSFGIDFNPTVDRLRVVASSGQNFRMNPNNGAFLDGDLGGAAGSVAGLNMDGSINGGTTTLDDAAYTNSVINTSVTTLYTIDSVTNSIFIQNPPNAGTQTLPLVVTLGGPLDFGPECGFDIALDVNAAVSNGAAIGDAFAALSAGGTSSLYRINLTTGGATLIGAFGLTARDIAVAAETATANVLSAVGTQIARFRVQNPNSGTLATLTGVVAGERIIGIDGRPATGQLMGVGVNPVANTASAYLIDPQTGAATVLGAASSIAFVDAVGTPVDLPDASWGLDFNPMVDRIRVISATGVNFRVNPMTGAPVDGDLGGAAGSVAGLNPDGAINGAIGVGIAGVAYANNIFGTTVTTQYTLDPLGNRLFIQNPPNSGAQTMPKLVSFNGTPFDFDSVAGFDIPPGVNAPTSGAEALGEGYVALGVPGTMSLYRIDLPTAAVQLIGAIGNGATTMEGLVVWTALADPLFRDGFE